MTWETLALTPIQAVDVVISATGIYCGFFILIRLLGQRTLANLSTFDFAGVVALGAVAGRAVLGYTPTLGAGIIALVTLLVLQAAVGQLRRTRIGARVVRNPPRMLMAGSKVLARNMTGAHVVESELVAKLRSAGIRNRSEVACVILEANGSISVLRKGAAIDRYMLEGVVGADQLPEGFYRPETA